MSEVKMTKGSETLASLAYTRDDNGQVKKTTRTGLPGEESIEAAYDEDNRLTKAGGTTYEYDAANDPTTEGSSTYTYNEADELEKGGGATFGYNESGERTKTTPSGAATTYGYNQAGDLVSIERPVEGEHPAIADSYTYDGNGLRASQTIGGTATYLAWDATESVPLLLSDGTNSYIYGPGNLPIEQVNNSTGFVLYLHHDQQGSIRMLTGASGKGEGTVTYDAYGNVTGTTGTAATPLGYDAQYTSSDTGLIYLRARVYDPKTAQFLSVDPAVSITAAPYTYASDSPMNEEDVTGLVATVTPNCETGTEQREKQERLHRLRELHRLLEIETREIAEERQRLKEENETFSEELLAKTAKAFAGCWAGSDIGTFLGLGAGASVGGPPGAVVGAGVGAVAGCAGGALGAGEAPVNPLQPSEGGP
jgi:RHS repeat-associated protein